MSADRHPRRRLAAWAPVTVALVAVLSVLLAVPASAKSDAEIEAESAPPVAGTPCTATAHACVDVNKRQAWLIKNGKIMRGPVSISTGGSGKDTPTGNVFRVYRKDKEFKSNEFKLPNGQPAPMPYAVFFEDGGIAFHAGSPARASAGCVHLNTADAIAFFNYLQIGDHVQVMNGPVAAKPLTPDQLEAANADQSGDQSGDESSDENGGESDRDRHHRHHRHQDENRDSSEDYNY